MIYHKIHICNLCRLHEQYVCGSSKHLFEKMICHKIHICNLCSPHELCECVASNFLLVKRIYHKIHTSNLCRNCLVWSFKEFRFGRDLEQIQLSLITFLFSSWTAVKWIFRYCLVVIFFSQISHLCFFFIRTAALLDFSILPIFISLLACTNFVFSSTWGNLLNGYLLGGKAFTSLQQ